MKRFSTSTKAAAALLVGAALVAGACGSSSKKTENTTTTAAPSATTATPGATSGSTTSAAPAKPSGQVTIAIEDNLTSLNNNTSADNTVYNSQYLAWTAPNIFGYDQNGDFFMDKNLLDSADVTSASPMVVKYVVNAKANWTDGEAIGCDDFYLQWISSNGKLTKKDDKGNTVGLFDYVGTNGYEQIDKIDCSADGKTVTMTYSKPYGDWKTLFWPLVPAHVTAKGAGLASSADIRKAYEANDAATLQKVADFWNTGFKLDNGLSPAIAVFGGPYVISDYTKDQSLTLKYNDKYWGSPPKLATVIARTISDATQMPAALKNGEIQVAEPLGNADLLNQLKQISDTTVVTKGTFSFDHFDFNFQNPLFQDKAVRTAMAKCIPRHDIVDKLIKPGYPDAKVLNNRMFIPEQPKYFKDTSGGAYDQVDIAGAKQALEADGWKLNGNVYEKGGKKLQFKLMYKLSNQNRVQDFQLIQSSCAQAGISVQDDGDAKWSSRLSAKQFDAVIFGWIGAPPLGNQVSIYKTAGGQNFGGWSNTQADALLDQITTELDYSKQADYANQVDTLAWQDLATIPLYQVSDILANSNKVKNVVFNPTQTSFVWNVPQWQVG